MTRKSGKKTKNWMLLFVMFGAVLGTAFGIKPWRFYAEQKATSAEANARAIEAERKTEADEELNAHYTSGIGREELARQNGWRLQGEVPVTTTP